MNTCMKLAKRCFGSERMLPKKKIYSPHEKLVRKQRMLKAIKIYENTPDRNHGKYLKEVFEAVKKLQPKRWLAPLNPCPVYNPKYGKKRKNKSIWVKEMPENLKKKGPEVWIKKFTENGFENKHKITLDNDIFDQKLRIDILHRCVMYHMARKRQGTAKQKNRSEVRGGGKKPWKQKGTGRARHGSRRSPIFRGGGKVHPKRPRKFAIKLQKAVRKMGIKVALSQKLREDNIIVVDKLPEKVEVAFKTLEISKLKKVFIVGSKKEISKNLVYREKMITNEKFPDVHLTYSKRTNVYALLKLEKFMITESALMQLTERLSKRYRILKENNQGRQNRERLKLIPDVKFE